MRTEKVEYWWGLPINRWVDAVAGDPPSGARLVARRAFDQDVAKYQVRLTVPGPPGRYPLVLIMYGGGGASRIGYHLLVES